MLTVFSLCRIFRFALFLAGLSAGQMAWAGLATNVTGLYFTGVNNSGALLAGGARDSHWSVTYARADGVNDNSTYQGAAYVVSSTANSSASTNYIDGAWVQNTSTAQWITAPGAKNPSGTANVGGVMLPGNGDAGTNRAQYVYTLAFTVSGTGSGTVTNSLSISLTVAADDQYKIYVNPVLNANGSVNTTLSSAAFTGTNAWNNTTSATLQNGTNGTNGNSIFNIGTNYLVVVVDNTNSATGSSSSTSINPSGLLMYQVGSAVLINGVPVPEPASIAFMGGMIGFCGLFFWRRQRRAAAAGI